MTAAPNRVTVVIPTHRRPAALERVLRHLTSQRDPGVPWDVVIVENDLLPGAVAHASADAIAALPVSATVVVEPALGAASARNRGIAEATGTIVAFVDDDVTPDPEWLATLIEPILAGRCEAIGGRVDLDPAGARPRWLAPWLTAYLSYFDPWSEEIDLQELPADVLIEPYFLTANCAMTADVLARSGGFDPMLGTRAGHPFGNEELQLCRAVLAAGGRIRYTPAARVLHELPPDRMRVRYLARRIYNQGRSDWMLDREWLGTMRSAGARRAFSLFAFDLRFVSGPRRKGPAPVWVLASAVRRAGFLREALAHLVRRR